MTIQTGFDFLVQWHLTERCNLQCTHCYQGECRGGELNSEECDEVLLELTEMFQSWEELYDLKTSPSFNVTGGEPLLRHDLFHVLEKINTLGFSTFLLTNGTLIDAPASHRLKEIGVAGVQVSLEGSEQIHDSIRGAGTFAAATAGIRALTAQDIPVIINVTLSRINAESLEDIIEVARNLGARKVGFSRFVPAGAGVQLMEHMLSPHEIKMLYENLLGKKTDGVEIVTGDPVASQMGSSPIGFPHSSPCGGCAAGVSGITILSDGTVVPCRRMEIPIGNVRTDSLRELWATSPLLQSLRKRDSYQGKCGKCGRWAACRGCRAISYAYSVAAGNPDPCADDPHCFMHSSGQ